MKTLKVVILAGGFGTRLSEETQRIPKPLVEIGSKPILWHIMKIYSHYGFKDFIICLGYKGHIIKEWFADYSLHNSDVIIDLKKNRVEVLKNHVDDWRVTLIDTGLNTGTGGRLKKIKGFLGSEAFFMTYGDGVSDVDIEKLLEFHRTHGNLVTLTAVQPAGRFGILSLDGTTVTRFAEKKDNESSFINGGFFVIEPEALNYISEDEEMWEQAPLETLAQQGQVKAYIHHGFWKAMDKLSDKKELDQLIASKEAEWMVWER